MCLTAILLIGAYYHGKLLCWRITQYDGSSEMAFTLPEARRLGLSYQIGVRLAAEVCKIQQASYGYVVEGNQQALRMVTKMGYRVTCKSDWIEFDPNTLSNSSSCRPTKDQTHQTLKSSI